MTRLLQFARHSGYSMVARRLFAISILCASLWSTVLVVAPVYACHDDTPDDDSIGCTDTSDPPNETADCVPDGTNGGCPTTDGCQGVENTACEPRTEGVTESRYYERYTPNIIEAKDQFEDETICSDEEVANNTCDCDNPGALTAGNCDIVATTEAGVNILGVVASLAIVGGIMYGGFLYMTARDNPGQVAAARSRIVWALVALLILLFFWSLLQWLIPGGLFGGGGGSGGGNGVL